MDSNHSSRTPRVRSHIQKDWNSPGNGNSMVAASGLQQFQEGIPRRNSVHEFQVEFLEGNKEGDSRQEFQERILGRNFSCHSQPIPRIPSPLQAHQVPEPLAEPAVVLEVLEPILGNPGGVEHPAGSALQRSQLPLARVLPGNVGNEGREIQGKVGNVGREIQGVRVGNARECQEWEKGIPGNVRSVRREPPEKLGMRAWNPGESWECGQGIPGNVRNEGREFQGMSGMGQGSLGKIGNAGREF